MKIIKKFFSSSYSILFSMILGIYIGISQKSFAQSISVFGDIYLNLLQIAVIPIVIFSLLLGVYYIKESSSDILKRTSMCMFFVVLVGLVLVILITIYIKPWVYIKDLSVFNNLFSDSKLIKPSEKLITDVIDDKSNIGILQLFANAIPSNIFSSLTYSNMLQVVAGSLIVGLGLYKASQRFNSTKELKNKLEYGLDVFTTINDTIVSFMPIGVFFLMLNQFVTIDFRVIKALAIIMLTISALLIIQILVYMFILCFRAKISFFVLIKHFSEAFLLIITTRSSIVALPSAMESMKKLKFTEGVIDVYVPLGVSLVRIGTMTFFSISTLFIMGIFEVPITIDKILFISFASILAAMSTIGTSGIVSLQMISIVLTPLGLPLGGVLAILVAVDAVTDLFDTFANLVGNLAIAALGDNKRMTE